MDEASRAVAPRKGTTMTRMSRLRESTTGNGWVAGILAILGVGLLIVGVYFFTLHPLIYGTALGYTFLGLGALCGLGVLYHHKVLWGSLALTLILVGVILLIIHYGGFIAGF